MKNIFAGMGVLGIVTLVALFVFGPLALSIYGLFVAFSANVWIGIGALIIEPAPFVIGVAKFFFSYDIPAHILASLAH